MQDRAKWKTRGKLIFIARIQDNVGIPLGSIKSLDGKMRDFSYSLERANSKQYVRFGKTLQLPVFRAQSQLCGSNTLKVRAI